MDETLPLPRSASKKDTSGVKESVKPSTSKAKQLLNNDITIENLKEVLGRPNPEVSFLLADLGSGSVSSIFVSLGGFSVSDFDNFSSGFNNFFSDDEVSF
jgi:hypothetical protein